MTARGRKRKQLQRKVFGAMGIIGGKPLKDSTLPKIHEKFHSGARARPLVYKATYEYSRLPIKHVGKFVDLERVKSELLSIKKINSLISKHPYLRENFDRLLSNAIRERGMKATELDWRARPLTHTAGIAKRAKGLPEKMNDEVGRISSIIFGNKIGSKTVVDIGTGTGDTIFRVVQSLFPKQRRYLRVILNDVIKSLPQVKRKLAEMGVPANNIQILPVSFYLAATAFKQAPRPEVAKGQKQYAKNFRELIGKADLVISGATFNNFSDTFPVVKAIRKILKQGGHFIVWDWAGVDVKEPSLDIASLRRVSFKVSKGIAPSELDNFKSFLSFWLDSWGVPTAREKLLQDIEKSNKFNFAEWVEKNLSWLERIQEERLRKDTMTGLKNRGYRMAQDLTSEFNLVRMNVEEIYFPFAEREKITGGNLTYLIAGKK
ncbi:MAG: hypothetical protein AB1467_04725 [Candidatus Diapherotrites archaeon]